jgi:hypothetical protein
MEEMGERGGWSDELLGAEDLVEGARMIVTRFSGSCASFCGLDSGASFCGLVSGFVDSLLSLFGSGAGSIVLENFDVGMSSGLISGVDLPDCIEIGGASDLIDSDFLDSSIMVFIFACLMNACIASSFRQSSDFSFAKQISIDELMALRARCLSRRSLA